MSSLEQNDKWEEALPPTDPKKAFGQQKTQMQLLPSNAMRACADVLALGASKYGEYNWRKSQGVEAMTYVGAIMRHLMQWLDGEDSDSESGQSHVAHIMASAAIVLDAQACGKLIDNREKLPENITTTT